MWPIAINMVGAKVAHWLLQMRPERHGLSLVEGEFAEFETRLLES